MVTHLLVPLIWNGITSKHSAYANEKEVRRIILGHLPQFSKIETRMRRAELIPFIRSSMATQAKGNITRIMVGPAAEPAAEEDARELLRSVGIDPTNLVVRSKIPYRGK
jgi:cell division septation protein DedD